MYGNIYFSCLFFMFIANLLLMPKLKFYFLFIFLFPIPSWSLTIDWEGFSRVEAYYSKDENKNYYGNLHFVLKPEIQVIDGLSVFFRADLYSFEKDRDVLNLLLSQQSIQQQTGYVFLNNNKDLQAQASSLFLNLSQVYIQYKTDILKLKIGRAPYHFGLGLTYSAKTNPFNHWVSVLNQATLYFEYFQFYFQPSVFYTSSSQFAAVLQGGIASDNWKVEALYHHGLSVDGKITPVDETTNTVVNSTDVTKSSRSTFLEVFGTHKKSIIENKLSVIYSFKDSADVALAYEGILELPINLSPQLELKAGYVPADLSFHPNYDVALLLWNRLVTTADKTSNIAQGKISDVAYFSPRISFKAQNDTLKITPIISVDYRLSNKTFHYELDIQAIYKLERKFSVLLQGGLLKSADKINYGLLAQAAVTF